jgi:hypothetical protein
MTVKIQVQVFRVVTPRCDLAASIYRVKWLHPEDGGNIVLRNVGIPEQYLGLHMVEVH